MHCDPIYQPVDNGVGRAIKLRMGDLLDDWLAEGNNLDRWSGSKSLSMTASDRRVLLTKLIADAWERVCEALDFEKAALPTGALMTIDKSGDEGIRPQGLLEQQYQFESDDAENESVASFASVSTAELEFGAFPPAVNGML